MREKFTITQQDVSSIDTSLLGVPPAPNYGLPFVPDIDFADKDPAIIVNEVIADYQLAFVTLTNIAKTLAPGDPVRLFLLVVCHWLSQQRVIIDFTGKQNLLKYANDSYLDNLAALHGNRTLRLQAANATTTLQFTLTSALAFDVTIQAGTQCQAPNSVVFTTLTSAIIPAGSLSVDVQAQANVAGALGNGFAPGQVNSVINWNQPFGLNVANTTVTEGGSDRETDDQYRYRIWLAIESYSTCGPHDAYEFWTLSAHPDIIQAVIYSSPEIAGEVWIYPLLRDGVIPTQDFCDNVVKPVVSADTRRPVTDYVSVFPATAFNYTLDITYYVLRTNEVLLNTIQANVAQAVSDWIAWTGSYISRDIIGDELRRRCLEAGAKRIVINSPTPDFQVMAYNQLAVHDPNVAPIITFPSDGTGLEDE
jgi:phage-related baseplate assembly protein